MTAVRGVSPGNEIRIQLRSNNANGDARIDYEALHVTYLSIPATPMPVTPPITPKRPGVFSVPNSVPTTTPPPEHKLSYNTTSEVMVRMSCINVQQSE